MLLQRWKFGYIDRSIWRTWSIVDTCWPYWRPWLVYCSCKKNSESLPLRIFSRGLSSSRARLWSAKPSASTTRRMISVATAASTMSIDFDILIFACAVESLIIVSRVLAVIGIVLLFLESTAWTYQDLCREQHSADSLECYLGNSPLCVSIGDIYFSSWSQNRLPRAMLCVIQVLLQKSLWKNFSARVVRSVHGHRVVLSRVNFAFLLKWNSAGAWLTSTVRTRDASCSSMHLADKVWFSRECNVNTCDEIWRSIYDYQSWTF